MLEDESGRIRLVGERLRSARPVTGVIMGVLGMETGNDEFEVIDFCFAGMPPQAGTADGEELPKSAMTVDSELVSQLCPRRTRLTDRLYVQQIQTSGLQSYQDWTSVPLTLQTHNCSFSPSTYVVKRAAQKTRQLFREYHDSL